MISYTDVNKVHHLGGTWIFISLRPPGVSGSWGEGLFVLRELGSTGNYSRRAGERAHTFQLGDLRSTAKKLRKNNLGIWRDQSIIIGQGSTDPPFPNCGGL